MTGSEILRRRHCTSGRNRQGHRVSRVTLEVGELSGVSSESIAFCFDMVIQGTALEGASLEIRKIEGRVRCETCGAEFAATTLFAVCPCGSHRLTRVQGEELNVKSMELMEAA